MRSDKTLPRMLLTVMAAGLVAAGCGGSGNDNSAAGDATTAPSSNPAADDTQASPDTQASAGNLQPGSGTATLKIGDKSYEFDGVQCAFGTDATHNKDWDFSLSAIKDGTQLSVSRGAEGGRYGDSISLDDFKNTDNPSVSWSAPATPIGGAPPGDDSFVEIDGKKVSVHADFTDGTEGASQVPVSGTLEATCP